VLNITIDFFIFKKKIKTENNNGTTSKNRKVKETYILNNRQGKRNSTKKFCATPNNKIGLKLKHFSLN